MQGLQLHPAEAILWTLFMALLLRVAVFRQPLRIPRFSYFGWAFLALVLVGGVVALARGLPLTVALRAMKPTLGIFPAFFVVYNVVGKTSTWLATAAIALVTGSYIALSGIGEYFLPGFALPFADFFFNEPVAMAPGGFRRGMFAFWGSPIGVFVPLIFTPWLLFTRGAGLSLRWRGLAGGLIALHIVALYISGHRGLWIGFAVILLASGFVGDTRAWRRVIVIVILGWLLLPGEFYGRMEQLMTLDPSAMTRDIDRIQRVAGAWDLALMHPLLGVGWGGSGWVHSDWLQIAADLGFPALFCFMAWYGSVVIRVREVAKGGTTAWTRAYGRALFASLAGIATAMLIEALIVLPELIFPVWFIFALASKLGEDERGAVYGQAFRSHSHLQQ